MPEKKISQMTGIHPRYVETPYDFSARKQRAVDGGMCPAHMTDEEWRQFLKEEQAEGMHPSLKGKRL